MPSKLAIEFAQRLSDLNARLDQVERLLDSLEDLLDQLWDDATEAPRTASDDALP